MSAFLIKSEFEISNLDFKIIRKLYQPLIGTNATVFLTFLYDYLENNNSYSFDYNDFIKFLDLDEKKILSAKKMLECYCLIKTFLKKDNSNTILIKLIKPLSYLKFNNNIIFKNNLINKIGNDNYQLFFNDKTFKYDKNDFEEITAKYIDLIENEDLFENSIYSNLKNKNTNKINNANLDLFFNKYQNTNEIELFKVNNINEAIQSYSTSQFLKYLTGTNTSIETSIWISDQNKNGFNDESLNLIIKYCKDLKNEINIFYIKKVVFNLFKENKLKTNQISEHFSKIIKNNKNNQSNIQINNSYPKDSLKKLSEINIFDYDESINDFNFEDIIKNTSFK